MSISHELPTMSSTFTPQSIHANQIYLSLFGQATVYLYGSSSANPTTLGNQYYSITLPSNNNVNWVPTWQLGGLNSSMSLAIPYSGIYAVKFTCQFGSPTSVYIVKNSNSVNTNDDNVIALSDTGSPPNQNLTLSGTTKLLSTDVITFGFWFNGPSGSTTSSVVMNSNPRYTITITLLSRM